ncbi:MAG: HupE/UreJ family protein, partial [Persicimonas sp.]
MHVPSKLYAPRLIGALFALVAAFALLPTAAAHQTSSSTLNAEIRPDDDQVDLLLAISARDLASHLDLIEGDGTYADDDDLRRVRPEMSDYLSAELAVENDDVECRPARAEAVDRTGSPDSLLYRYTAQCDDDLGEVEIKNRVMLETPGGYTHYGRIQLGDDVQTTLFDRTTPSYTVEVASTGDEMAEQDTLEMVRLYVWEGILHILIGIDHVLFVLLLLVAARGFHRLLWIITSFTVAHSITLALSALELVSLSPGIVEPLIAASIAWLAVELLLDREPGKHLLAVTFGFGLLHGFGFSYVLRDNVGLPTDALVPALFSFNVGVELGQIAIVCAAYPLVAWARDKEWGEVVVKVLAGGVLAVS